LCGYGGQQCQVLDPVLDQPLQVQADRIDVYPGDELRAGLEHRAAFSLAARAVSSSVDITMARATAPGVASIVTLLSVTGAFHWESSSDAWRSLALAVEFVACHSDMLPPNLWRYSQIAIGESQ
jgi:adenylylsulfate kinase-like enzyme